ncbi:hypothetical protein GGR56DRAFT_635972 [Xylariaceae sp. FL0804]|nr:hypothetical protein GGR56DRAFT_635972 [Xylariaceae sp. FL0804]
MGPSSSSSAGAGAEGDDGRGKGKGGAQPLLSFPPLLPIVRGSSGRRFVPAAAPAEEGGYAAPAQVPQQAVLRPQDLDHDHDEEYDQRRQRLRQQRPPFRAALDRVLALRPDEARAAALLRPLKENDDDETLELEGPERMRELGLRTRAYAEYLAAWEDLHVGEDAEGRMYVALRFCFAYSRAFGLLVFFVSFGMGTCCASNAPLEP